MLWKRKTISIWWHSRPPSNTWAVLPGRQWYWVSCYWLPTSRPRSLVVMGVMPLLVAVPLMAFVTYASYTVLHDAAHGSISGSHASLRWVNETMGYIAAWIFMMPLTAHRHEHLAHHRHANQPNEDPDFVVADMTRSPFHALRARNQHVHRPVQLLFQKPLEQGSPFTESVPVPGGVRRIWPLAWRLWPRASGLKAWPCLSSAG